MHMMTCKIVPLFVEGCYAALFKNMTIHEGKTFILLQYVHRTVLPIPILSEGQ